MNGCYSFLDYFPDGYPYALQCLHPSVYYHHSPRYQHEALAYYTREKVLTLLPGGTPSLLPPSTSTTTQDLVEEKNIFNYYTYWKRFLDFRQLNQGVAYFLGRRERRYGYSTLGGHLLVTQHDPPRLPYALQHQSYVSYHRTEMQGDLPDRSFFHAYQHIPILEKLYLAVPLSVEYAIPCLSPTHRDRDRRSILFFASENVSEEEYYVPPLTTTSTTIEAFCHSLFVLEKGIVDEEGPLFQQTMSDKKEKKAVPPLEFERLLHRLERLLKAHSLYFRKWFSSTDETAGSHQHQQQSHHHANPLGMASVYFYYYGDDWVLFQVFCNLFSKYGIVVKGIILCSFNFNRLSIRSRGERNENDHNNNSEEEEEGIHGAQVGPILPQSILQTLQVLKLKDVEMDDDGFSQLFRGGKGSSVLQVLMLPGTNVHHLFKVQETETASPLFPSVEMLDLSGCHLLTEESLQAVEQMCPRLRFLYLSSSSSQYQNYRSPQALQGVHALVAPERWSCLTILDLKGIQSITNDGLTALPQLSQLQELDLTYCPQITSLYSVWQCSRLRRLHCGGSSGIPVDPSDSPTGSDPSHTVEGLSTWLDTHCPMHPLEELTILENGIPLLTDTDNHLYNVWFRPLWRYFHCLRRLQLNGEDTLSSGGEEVKCLLRCPLKVLELTNNRRYRTYLLRDIATEGGMRDHLETLYLYHCPFIMNHSEEEGKRSTSIPLLHRLREVYVCRCASFFDFNNFRQLPSLEHLELYHNGEERMENHHHIDRDLSSRSVKERSFSEWSRPDTHPPSSTPSRLSIRLGSYLSLFSVDSLGYYCKGPSPRHLLHTLDLTGCQNLLTEGLSALRYCRTLTKLYLKYCSNVSSVAAVAGLPLLRVLHLHGTSVDDEGIDGLALTPRLADLALVDCTQLQFQPPQEKDQCSRKASFPSPSEKGAAVLYPSLELLHLTGTKALTNDGLAYLLTREDRPDTFHTGASCPRLHTLNVTETSVDAAEPFFTGIPTLKDANLRFNHLSGKSLISTMKAVYRLLSEGKTIALERIDLRNVTISPAFTWRALMLLLAGLPSLRLVDLRGIDMGMMSPSVNHGSTGDGYETPIDDDESTIEKREEEENVEANLWERVFASPLQTLYVSFPADLTQIGVYFFVPVEREGEEESPSHGRMPLPALQHIHLEHTMLNGNDTETVQRIKESRPNILLSRSS